MKRSVDAYASYGIAVLAFALSYSKLVDLADRAGYSEHMAQLWPLAVDGLAVMAARAVMRLKAGRGFAWALLVGGTVVSILAAILGAMVPPGPLPPFATAAVTIIPPICLPLAAHLARKMRDAAPQDAAVPEADAAALEIATPEEAVSTTAVLPQETSAAPEPEVSHLFEVTVPAAVRQPKDGVVAAVVDAAPDAAAKKRKVATSRTSATRRSADPDLIADAVRLLAAGTSYRGIGRALGIDDRTVRRWRDDGLLAAS
ncbi:DUF2637 domain-containing protein [Prescottella equi]|uniref:DUF2637 domain-containing protein n=1 Tax=Rhodococcus hoagii TaxID=43767 RepID=UPI000A0F7CDB|nr:DUF2637 domain-containing protein [Prescottella equi]ORL15429.1 hypothetical protein A6I85_06010 [Prescottella equi]